MKFENNSFDEERALYGLNDIDVASCRFDGPADGESAMKECNNIRVCDCFFNLRYPFWHDKNLQIKNSEMTTLCRAALWYSENISIDNCKMHGIKALRECSNATITNSHIVSPEFGWSVNGLKMSDTCAESEYFLMRSSNINFKNVDFTGKYSFQYVENALIEDCNLNTKDAFWHAKNVTVRNSTVKGEYLAWYCEDVTFENCIIIGTQPLCYCKGLKLINCTMQDCDLAFEKSEVEADIHSKVDSIKNPYRGRIIADAVGETILDDVNAKAEIIIR